MITMTIINCFHCNKSVSVKQKEINQGFGKFCSRSCSAQFREKNKKKQEPNVKCAICQKDFYKNLSRQKNSKSGIFFCCRAHKYEAMKVGGIMEVIFPHNESTGIYNYRVIAFRVKPKICERCGYDHNEAALIVHHKDRNRNNNVIDNLEILCANCHAIEHLGELVEPVGVEPTTSTLSAWHSNR